MSLFERSEEETLAAELHFPAYRFGVDTPEAAEDLVERGVGGFCLFGGEASEVLALTERLQAKARVPLLFAADYERGTGQWVKGGSRLPANMAFGAAADEALAFEKGRLTGLEAKALGVDWVLAPVVDLATRPENPIVNTRAFGAEPALVTRLAAAFLKGLESAGALGCLKHFPGHGETALDSHLELPTLERSLAQLEAEELAPYRGLAASAPALMLGHLLVPALDPEDPASLSAQTVARLRAMGFTGLVVTDALSMGAVVQRHPAKGLAAKALNAGADILLVPDVADVFHTALVEAVEEGRVPLARLRDAHARVRSLKAAAGLLPARPARAGIAGLQSAACGALSARTAGQALVWVRAPAAPLKAGGTAAYVELGSAEGEENSSLLKGELRASGLVLEEAREGGTTPLVAAVFNAPRAYAGTINLPEADRVRLAALAKGRDARVAAFGSPFVAAQTALPTLLAFSAEPAFQKAAADVLLGRKSATGTLPVKL